MSDVTLPNRRTLIWALFAVACSGDPRTFVENSLSNDVGGDAGVSSSAGTAGAQGGSGAAGGDVGDAGGSSGLSGTGGTTNIGGTGGSAAGGGSGTAGSGSAGSGSAGGVVAPKPGKPGYGSISAGSYMVSPGYRLVAAIGDSPGGNVTGTSTSYRLAGGVIGTTQP